jgi:HEPN domain-containing protein
MASRAEDWVRQARRDLAHAGNALADGTFEWAAFAAQQGAEKAVKAVFQHLGGEARGHSVSQLLGALPEAVRPPRDLIEAAKELDKHYIRTALSELVPGGSAA